MNSVKKEKSAAIDIPSLNGIDTTHPSSRSRSSTHNSKSTDSTPKDTPKDTPPKLDEEVTPPNRTHSPIDIPPLAGGLSMLERSYSEPVCTEEPCVGEQRGGGKEGIVWNNSVQQLVTSSLPDSAVAIQIEVSDSVLVVYRSSMRQVCQASSMHLQPRCFGAAPEWKYIVKWCICSHSVRFFVGGGGGDVYITLLL